MRPHGMIKRAVVIGNGCAGAENQCFGLVRALGLSNNLSFYRVTRPTGGVNSYLRWLPVAVHKAIDYSVRRVFNDPASQLTGKERDRCAGLANIREADEKQIAKMAHENFDKDGPLLVVASGRDTISMASSIKRLAQENAFVIQIQHPRTRLNRFDLVITPSHDYYPLTPEARKQVPPVLRWWITPREPPGKHVILTVGALHQADHATLHSAASTWHSELAPLPKPLLVINIGGPSRNCRYGENLAMQLSALVPNVIDSCGSIRISFSRRTPEKVSQIIKRLIGNHPKVYVWGGEGLNPHLGHLAWGDAFVITADSVSMLSEACSTGKPVYVVGGEFCTWKLADFHKSLQERGLVRPLTGKEDISEKWSYPPLNDITEAAGQVREALCKRGWTM